MAHTSAPTQPITVQPNARAAALGARDSFSAAQGLKTDEDVLQAIVASAVDALAALQDDDVCLPAARIALADVLMEAAPLHMALVRRNAMLRGDPA